MAIVREQYAGNHSTVGGTSLSKLLTSNVVEGDLLIVAITIWQPGGDRAFQAGDLSVSGGAAIDTPLLAATQTSFDTGGGDYIRCAVFSAKVTTGGPCTVTVGNFLSGSFGVMGIGEYSGMDTTAERTAGTNGTTGTSSPAVTGNMTSTGAAVFFGVVGVNTSTGDSLTPEAAFFQIYEEDTGSYHVGGIEERIVTEGTTDQGEWTESYPWVTAMAVFKAASGGGGGGTPGSLVFTVTM